MLISFRSFFPFKLGIWAPELFVQLKFANYPFSADSLNSVQYLKSAVVFFFFFLSNPFAQCGA